VSHSPKPNSPGAIAGAEDLPPLEARTVGAVLRRSAAHGPGRPAVFFKDSVITSGELDELAERVTGGLLSLGVQHGDRVAVMMPNRPEYLALYYGVARLGAVFVPLVTQSKLMEVEYFLEHSGATVLVADAERWDQLSRATARHPSPIIDALQTVIVLGEGDSAGSVGWGEFMAVGPSDEVPVVTETDVVAFMYTSGTTGRPKAVIHPHSTAVAQAEAVSGRMRYTPEDRLMTIFPLFHGNALVWSALTATYSCAALVLTERFSASQFWNQVREYEVTEVNLLVGAINMLLAQSPSTLDREHTLRATLATITESIYERFTERFGVDIVTLWAFAEGPIGTMVEPGYGYRPGLIGWPMGGFDEVRVVDETGRDVPAGEVGELIVSDVSAMRGYYKNPEETARVMRGGWVHSGDLGYRDEDGLFYFVGREKHTIRRAGENVSGEEVENCISSHPQVVECAAIPVPDEIRGEEIKACVVLASDAAVSEGDIVDWVAERLADFKVPRYIQFRSSLPKTGPEKVQLHVLKAEPDLTACWDRLAAASSDR
jgi:crotonobetaine/carnitine-CoA ligase